MDSEIIRKIEPIADSAIYAVYYRIFGQASLPITIDDFLEFIHAEMETGKYNGDIEWVVNRERIKWFKWKNIHLSKPGVEEPVTFDVHVWGVTKKYGARNVVITRVGFWRAYLVRSRIEHVLGLPAYSLAPLK